MRRPGGSTDRAPSSRIFPTNSGACWGSLRESVSRKGSCARASADRTAGAGRSFQTVESGLHVQTFTAHANVKIIDCEQQHDEGDAYERERHASEFDKRKIVRG